MQQSEIQHTSNINDVNPNASTANALYIDVYSINSHEIDSMDNSNNLVSANGIGVCSDSTPFNYLSMMNNLSEPPKKKCICVS